MSVQRVVVVRSGGFAGVERRVEVDDPDRADRLSRAVRSDARHDPEDRARDGFVYEFTVVTTSSEHRVALPEGAMDEDLRAAVRALFR